MAILQKQMQYHSRAEMSTPNRKENILLGEDHQKNGILSEINIKYMTYPYIEDTVSLITASKLVLSAKSLYFRQTPKNTQVYYFSVVFIFYITLATGGWRL